MQLIKKYFCLLLNLWLQNRFYCAILSAIGGESFEKEITFTAKQVGERVKERRTELNLTMPELGKRVGVNKSTIQRYEADGVDPKRTMIINGLAEALLTTPEWLTGLSEDKEYDSRTLCARDMEEHIKNILIRFLLW